MELFKKIHRKRSSHFNLYQMINLQRKKTQDSEENKLHSIITLAKNWRRNGTNDSSFYEKIWRRSLKIFPLKLQSKYSMMLVFLINLMFKMKSVRITIPIRKDEEKDKILKFKMSLNFLINFTQRNFQQNLIWKWRNQYLIWEYFREIYLRDSNFTKNWNYKSWPN